MACSGAWYSRVARRYARAVVPIVLAKISILPEADDVALSERVVTSSNYKTSLASATAATSLRK